MLLAVRLIEDSKQGADTSFDVRSLAMAYADLVYWRGLQKHIAGAPAECESAIKALTDTASVSKNPLLTRRG